MPTAPFDYPGGQHLIATLLAAYEQVVATGQGRTVFVGGDDGSGREELLEALAGAVADRAAVAAGSFDSSGIYTAQPGETRSPRAVAVLRRIAEAGEPVAAMTADAMPYGDLLGRVLTLSRMAFEATERYLEASRGQEPPDLAIMMPKALRTLAEERPAVCVVDNADLALSGWWTDLVVLFARRVAKDLPLLFVLGVSGPHDLGEYDPDEPDVRSVARTLVADDVATWQPLPPVGVDEVRRWTSGASHEMAQALVDVSRGQAAWVAHAWNDWQARRVVQRQDDGRWVWVRGPIDAVQDVADSLGTRLATLLDTTSPVVLDTARTTLAFAALEGRRFTAEAAALASRRDRDAVLNEFDDKLTHEPDREDGLVVEDGLLSATYEIEARALWRYRFRSKFDWLALRHYGFAETQHAHQNLVLAEALEAVYADSTSQVALILARLYRAAGKREEAVSCQRQGERGVSRAVMLWRARNALASPTPSDPVERRRAFQALLAAGRELADTGPFDQSRQFAREARRLAPSEIDEAQALFVIGLAESVLGEAPSARAHFEEALALYNDAGDLDGQIACRRELADVQAREGRYDEARAELGPVVELTRQLGDETAEANARFLLAQIDAHQGRFERAREEAAPSLALARRLRDRPMEAAAHHLLARIDEHEGRIEDARDGLKHALRLYREDGNTDGEASTRGMLARIDLSQGLHEAARQQLKAVLALRRTLGDLPGQAATRHALAEIEVERGNYDRAKQELAAVLPIRQQVRDLNGTASTLHLMARIDFEQHDYEAARRKWDQVLVDTKQMGHDPGKAAALMMLGQVDVIEMRPHVGRERLEEALRLFQAMGDESGAAACAELLNRLAADNGAGDPL